MSSSVTYTTNSASDNSSILENFTSLFSNKNVIIIILLVLVIFSLIGINLLSFSGAIVSNVAEPLVPFFKGLLSMIGFTTGQLIKGSADLVADTADVGIDIAKGTTHSIGDLLINANQPGIDYSKQISLTDVIGVSNIRSMSNPLPIQSSNPTITPISTQKPKAGWCYVGDFSEVRGCVEVTEHDKCISGQIFAKKSECLNPQN
jgi:hypothetical protein